MQKYGGTSLANQEQRDKVCGIVHKTLESGSKVVIVVSAMGRQQEPYATDRLIQMVKEVNPKPIQGKWILLCLAGRLFPSGFGGSVKRQRYSRTVFHW